jgi:hypothetical protein
MYRDHICAKLSPVFNPIQNRLLLEIRICTPPSYPQGHVSLILLLLVMIFVPTRFIYLHIIFIIACTEIVHFIVPPPFNLIIDYTVDLFTEYTVGVGIFI